jgi:hypothetical protein
MKLIILLADTVGNRSRNEPSKSIGYFTHSVVLAAAPSLSSLQQFLLALFFFTVAWISWHITFRLGKEL